MALHLSVIGWLHTLASLYALGAGALVLSEPKGDRAHKRAGRQYLVAAAVANLSALAIHKLGAFHLFHVFALVSLACLVLAFCCARLQAPRRNWLRTHLSAMLFSYYQLVAALVHEVFTRVPMLETRHFPLVYTQGLALLAFLMTVSYFWGRTAPSAPSSRIYDQQPTTGQ
ncbi:DUF2306 domain-containing protein [Duganella sp. LX20W]|uniref:DUF2306 domain-containing protein n=1 Tax=Rugamonas brunnea TaxID=2758569 RepID=A0A7W2IC08_9BURK|nr:DUF2306 domain-containing protein [Rugamonas brunnea]MBA5637723.1 DUF2306 domain-containing protein [Rugamonas brunnea]